MLELLVTTFQDLRSGRTVEGTVVERPSTVMSTAEAVSVAFGAGLDGCYFGSGAVEPRQLVNVSLGERGLEDCKVSGSVWHESDGRFLATYHEGPPFGKIQSGYILLVELEPEIIKEGRLYMINRDGLPQIRRARVEGEKPNLSKKDIVGELAEVRIMPGIL